MAKKTSFGSDFGPFSPNSGHQFIFSKIWLRQSLDIMVIYHNVQYQKKLMIQSFTTESDRRTDEQADKSDFIGRCLTNVERQNRISFFFISFFPW